MAVDKSKSKKVPAAPTEKSAVAEVDSIAPPPDAAAPTPPISTTPPAATSTPPPPPTSATPIAATPIPATPAPVPMSPLHLDNGMKLPPDLPLLSGKELLVFPNIVMPLSIESERDRQMLDRSLIENRLVIVVPLEREMSSPQDLGALHRIGCVVLVHKMLHLPNGEMRVLIQGIQRARLESATVLDAGIRVRVTPLPEAFAETLELQALFDGLRKLFMRLLGMIQLPEEVVVAAHNISLPGQFCDLVVNNLELSFAERRTVFDEINVNERCKKMTVFLNRYLQVVELSNRIQEDVQKKLGNGHKEFYLREQLKAIQKELHGDDGYLETEELRKRLDEKNLPEEAAKEAKRELTRLSHMQSGSAEFTVARTYIDWLLDLPWHDETADNIDLQQAREILDRDHYNLKKIKERIVEFLAVRKKHPAGRSPILCLVGPPGVGKTSLGQSIATAMGRKFVRHSLGGVRDEAEIRGHRRTYVGSLPGRIIQGLKRAGSRNPLFMLDEIDKLASDFRGDPSSALLETLDPEQNHSFLDHYLDVPFDLSKVIFIATANQTDSIPDALLDRMEVINLPGYSTYEKTRIARQHLLPRIFADHGVAGAEIKITDPALDLVIRGYTYEAGLRGLERQLAAITRKAVVKLAAIAAAPTITVTPATVKEMLGPVRVLNEIAGRANLPGISIGLVWTPVGGGILFIESTKMRGGKNLLLTGSLGDVIKESATAAVSWIRARAEHLPIDSNFYDVSDYHIHFPDGATPKDGPSAGLALVASLMGLLVKTRIKPYLAMTGEITLRGKVLPVGGIKEKMIGAHLAGIREVILPKQNLKDLDELPREVKDEIKFYPVTEIREMLPLAFPDFKTLKKPAASKIKERDEGGK
ncbi:MAG: endopeptidase La [Planctomycetota bacterium]|jgi:ATP-dependent Lon protease|nr:endopeptidase La [Planctomycetota bacterium]